MPENTAAREELEEWIADAIRGGYTLDSQVGDSAFISRKVPVSGGAVLMYLILIVVLFPIGLLFIIPWVNASKRVIRFEIRIDDSGEVVQEEIGATPAAVRAALATANTLLFSGIAIAGLGLLFALGRAGFFAWFLLVAGVVVAAFGWHRRSTADHLN